jgi:lipopolysaccharide heptosyltransferase I
MPRFLIVRLGALGDILHALPVAAALRRARPDAEIDWVVDRRHRALVDMCPLVDEVVAVDGGRLGGPSGWLATRRHLRAAGYDAALDVQGLLKSAVVARASGAREVVGFATPQLRERAARWFYTRQAFAPRAPHVIDRNLTVIEALDLDVDHRREIVLEPPPASPAIAEILREREAPFVLLNAGGNWPNKRWPPERFGALAARVRERTGLGSLVLWGPGDAPLAGQVVETAGGAATLAPGTTLADVMHLARAAAVVVSGDTGPLHLAAAVGAPCVGLYGPTDPARNGPWSLRDLSLSRHAICRCSHQRRCRAARWCLDDLGVDEVVDAVVERLRRAGEDA